MKLNRNKIIGILLVLTVLAGFFWFGGNAPGLRGFEGNAEQNNKSVNEAPKKQDAESQNSKDIKTYVEENKKKADKNVVGEKVDKNGEIATPNKSDIIPESKKSLTAAEKTALASELSGQKVTTQKGDVNYTESQGMAINKSTRRGQFNTDPVPIGKPVPVEPQNASISDKQLTCTLSVRCETILDNMDWLDPEKVELIPKDGVIFTSQEVTFYEGESVFNILLREMKKNKTHLEFVNTPIFNSAYIEGINNIYEFDCGELSGWMYKVNDWFPNYGCSRYQLKQGDVVEWSFSCNLGPDVGNNL